VNPHKSLDAVTATGAGTVLDLHEVKTNHTLQVIVTGGPASLNVDLEGSLDGAAFVALASVSAVGGGLATTSGGPIRYLRAKLTALSGGSSPTVTAWIASI
jgi:hypothetical protein